MSPLAFFLSIATYLESNFRHINRGYMLSSPALEYKGRAFAFCQEDRMIVKLGEEQAPALNARNIRCCPRYIPFNGGHSSDQWIQIPFYYYLDWREIAELAIEDLQDQYGS